jgi:Flp pilus assembly pilin Flp
MQRKGRAQSFTEFALLIALIAMALIAMRVFMVRAIQERFRQSIDVFGQGEQYQKGVTNIIQNE